jgi:cobalt/nickel transport system ATP-binding protein
MSAVIEVRGLRFRYDGGSEALAGVDFSMQPGESVALLGRNGSGKTTFLLHLNGILRGEGEVRVCGMTVEPRNFTSIRRKIGFLFQDPEDQLFLPTLLEDVSFGLRRAGWEETAARGRAVEILEQVGVTEGLERAPYRLSGGEKQRVALAGILAVQPEVLALDEPTTHLDPPARAHLLELLATLPQSRLVATHDSNFARALCGRAVFFEKGRIIADGPVDEIIRRFGWNS